MTTLAAVHGVLPPHRYAQADVTEAFAEVCLGADADSAVLGRLHRHARVGHRHLCLPLERYRELTDFGEANDAYLDCALDLGTEAVAGALERAGIASGDVDMILTTSTTGISVPSIEARIAGRLDFRPDMVRIPLFGLGCAAGAAGVARLHDYLLGHPDQVAVLLSVELCSLTVQRGDRSMANLVASGLFGDGAAAVVAVGADRAAASGLDGPRVLASRSHLFPKSLSTMGWDVRSSGLKVILGADVPDLVRTYLGEDVRGFLADHDMTIADIGTWVSHPGGPKVIEAIESTLDLPDGALDVTWQSLADVGNLSSASVLHVLADTIGTLAPERGSAGLMMALGPGFSSELVLLQW